ERLAPIVDDSYFDVMMAAEVKGNGDKSTAREDAVERASPPPRASMSRQITELRNALEIAAQTHLIATLLSEGSLAGEAAALVPIQDRFRAASHTLGKAVAPLTDEQLKTATAELLRYGQGEAGIFAMRRRELGATSRAEGMVAENVAIQGELD